MGGDENNAQQQQGGSRHTRRGTAAQSQIMNYPLMNSTNLNSYNARMSAYPNGAPVYYETLQFAWFFFDVILKSFMLMSDRIHDGGYKFQSLLKDLIKALADKVRTYRDDFTNTYVAFFVNQHVAAFCRDLFDTNMKPMYVFELIEIYMAEVLKERVKSPALLKLLADFVHILSDHPQFIPLNNQLYQAQDLVTIERVIASPPVRLIVHVVRESLHGYRNDNELQSIVLHTIRYILTKHDWDKRYASEEQRAFIAKMYLPYVLMLLGSVQELHQLQLHFRKEHVKCALWIMSNIDTNDPLVQQQLFAHPQLLRLCAICVEAIVPSTLSRSSRASAEAMLTCMQQLFTKMLLPPSKEQAPLVPLPPPKQQKQQDDDSVTAIYISDVLQSSSTISSSSTTTTNTTTITEVSNFDYALYTLCTLLSKLQEFRLPISQSLYDTFRLVFLEPNANHFYQFQSHHWKWLYGTVISLLELPFSMVTDADVLRNMLQL
jgi:hypothetical protein